MTPIERKARELLAAECARTTDSHEAIVRAILRAYPEVLRAIASAMAGAWTIPQEPSHELVEELAYLIDEMQQAGKVTEDIGIAAYRAIQATALTPPAGGLPELPPFGIDTANHASVRVRGYTTTQLHAYALEAIAASRVGWPDGWVLVPKADLQRALEGIKVPKMSPVKQECFKAGTHAVIRAFNAVLEATPQVALNRD